MSLLPISDHPSQIYLSSIISQAKPISILSQESKYNYNNCLINGIKGLNVISRYANHLPESIREHIQNWRDQCVSLALNNDKNYTIDTIQVIIKIENNWKSFIMYSTTLKNTLGFIITINQNNKLLCEFCNYSTILHQNILQFGRTTKQSNQIFAGNFGEGMKVEINRLISSGASIIFYTGRSIWKFNHANDGELFVSFHENHNKLTNTHIIMNNIPLKADIDTSHYIFFNNDIKSIKLGNIEFILNYNMAGNVYMLGIFVMKVKQDDIIPKIGINFLTKDKMTIGRDRNHFKVLEIVLEILNTLNNIPKIQQCNHLKLSEDCNICKTKYVLSLFYKLHRTKLSNSTWNQIDCSKCIQLPEHMIDMFLFNEDSKSVPVSHAESVKLESDAKLLGITLITCSPFLLKLLQRSNRCPTMDKVIQSKAKAYAALPELVITKDEEIPFDTVDKKTFPEDYANIAIQIRKLATEVFNTLIIPSQIRFKDCTRIANENTSKVLHIKISNTSYYIFDFRYFILNSVHDNYKQEDPDFHCNSNKCGCVVTYAFECLISSLKSVYPNLNENIYRTKAMRYAMCNISPELNTKIKSDINIPTISQIEPIPINGDLPSSSEDLTMGNKISQVQYQSTTYDNPNINDMSTKCINISSILSPVKELYSSDDIIPPSPIQKTIQDYWCCTQKDKGSKYICNGHVGNIPFVININKVNQSFDTQNIQTFAYVITLLANHVFNIHLREPKQKNIECINIFYDDTSASIAFNLSSRLFFNYYYYNASDSPQTNLSFWFSVFCHELAHNEEKNHNERHNFAMTQLHKTYLPLFSKLCTNIKI